ncbi:MAG: DUF1836 domain-containing protein [Lachnospiraceae bacterium]|nr:DUF1836 domain-containing protein [Lachnospiraceae bacterium]
MNEQDFESIFDELAGKFSLIELNEIPGIDLYMDQVTTFLEDQMKPYTRDPDNDKIVTRTMINNYTKARILPPPVKKKYGKEQLLILILVYYMKNFLSLSDIHNVFGDLPDDRNLSDIYREVMAKTSDFLTQIEDDIRQDIRNCKALFPDEEDPEKQNSLRRFMLICSMSIEMYIRKLYLEKLVDSI